MIVYARLADGSLKKVARVATGGVGTGQALGSLGGLALSSDGPPPLRRELGERHRHRLRRQRPPAGRTDVKPTQESDPVSLTFFDPMLYVLDAGGAGDISGFTITSRAKLRPIPASERGLSNQRRGAAPDVVQIRFYPAGKLLAVTERDTGKILFYQLDGVRPIERSIYDSPGAGPNGFAFDPGGFLMIAESASGGPGLSTVSWLALHRGIQPTPVTTSTGDQGTSAMGVAATPNNKYVYVSNSGSGSISSFAVDAQGALTLTAAQAAVTGSSSRPGELSLTRDAKQLYVLCPGARTVRGFEIGASGALTRLGRATIPASASGIAAW